MEEELANIRRELATLRQMMVQVVGFVREAESEIPEKMRRFVNYLHDLQCVTYMYEERGLVVPPHVLREMERCDDRLRQLLEELHYEGGTFAEVRAKMAADPNNRWDHTRRLTAPKENGG